MAAVLNPFRSWLSAESRAPREIKEVEPKMAEEAQVMMPLHESAPASPTSRKDQHEEDAQPQSDTYGEEQEQEPDDEYNESVVEDNNEDFTITAKRASKRKRQNQHAFQKNARLKASASETEVSVDSNGSSSEEEAPWEAESDSIEDGEQVVEDASNCIICGEDENDDPGEDFEDPYSCYVCGEKAHRQCAREANLSPSEEEAENWRCPSCVENGYNHDSPNGQLRKSAASKFARDLLPAQRGVPKPGYHSVFNTLILSDDPLDGSRSLRKRKASSESQDKPPTELRKRVRRTTNEVEKLMTDGSLDLQPDITSPITDNATDALTPRTRGSRRAAQRNEKPIISVVEFRKDESLTIVVRLPPEKLGALDHEKRKKRKREYERLRREKLQRPLQTEPEIDHFPGLPVHTLKEQYIHQEQIADGKTRPKPYGGILNDTEADTSKTFPQVLDMKKFEDARKKAEEEWKKKMQASVASEPIRTNPKSTTSASKIRCINFGGFEIDTWHAAPYPEEYTRNRVLFICEFCLKYMNSDFVAWRHKLKCPAKHPPGDEIYRDGQFSFFEVDGRKNPVYCQNLCLLAKLFLGSKTLYYDVEPFLFYIMTENDDFGCHFVGYFSKEKRPSSQNNVSCILVLPIHQRRGFGNLLIDFSYLLTRTEGKTGSPEKPLSDMGLVTYRSYWRLVMCHQLVDQSSTLSINDISERTGMTADDVICALEGLRALVRDPITKTYALRLDYAYMQEYVAKYEAKGYAKLNDCALLWVPYLMGRDNQHYETAAPLHTVAQRDDTDDPEPEEGVQQAAAEAAAQAGIDGKAYNDSASKDASTPEEQDTTLTSFPTISAQDAHGTHTSTPKVTPTTPFLQIDGIDDQTHSIPATRFEIFPPIPGTTVRRKGRPPKRASAWRNTPARAGLALEETSGSGISGGRPLTLRRGRSKLGEVINGEDLDNYNDPVDAQDAQEPQSPSHGRGTTSKTDDQTTNGQDEEINDVGPEAENGEG